MESKLKHWGDCPIRNRKGRQDKFAPTLRVSARCGSHAVRCLRVCMACFLSCNYVLVLNLFRRVLFAVWRFLFCISANPSHNPITQAAGKGIKKPKSSHHDKDGSGVCPPVNKAGGCKELTLTREPLILRRRVRPNITKYHTNPAYITLVPSHLMAYQWLLC